MIVRILLFREWEWNSIERDIINSQDEIRSLFFRLAYVSASAFNKLRRLEYKGYLFRTSGCRLMRLFNRERRSSKAAKAFRYYHPLELEKSMTLWNFHGLLVFDSSHGYKSALLARGFCRVRFRLNRGSMWEQLAEASFHATTFNNSVWSRPPNFLSKIQSFGS